MTLAEFLQWLSVGGVTILGLIVTTKSKNKENEHNFINQLQEELKTSNEKMNKITERLDRIESENISLKEINYKLQVERDVAVDAKVEAQRSKDNMEKELGEKIEKLVKENRNLKDRVVRLENERKTTQP